MFYQHVYTTKTLQATLAKVFVVFILCFVKHKPVKIFDVQIMWLAFSHYKETIHWIFKWFIWNVDWKNQLNFKTIHINANVVFCFNLAKIFFLHRKFNPIIIKIISKLFIVLWHSFWMYFSWINMPNRTL